MHGEFGMRRLGYVRQRIGPLMSISAVFLVVLSLNTPCLAAKGTPNYRIHTKLVLGDGNVVSVTYTPVEAGSRRPGLFLPEDKVWSPSGDVAATFETQTALQVEDTKLPPGQYSIYLASAGDDWILIVNQEAGQEATSYPDGWDIVRAPTKRRRLAVSVPRLSFALERHGSTGGALRLRFGETEVWVTLKELPPDNPAPDAS